MHAPLARALALSFGALTTLLSATAWPCWDGYLARIGDLEIRGGGDPGQWSPEQARLAARWGTRIATIVPPGAKLAVDWSGVTCEGAACGAVDASGATSERLPDAFERLARTWKVPSARRGAAKKIDPEVFTVQVFAGSHRGARKAKASVVALEQGFFGFYEAGGFPATNDDAHVLREGGIHRVVVGTYLDREEANRARAELAKAGLRGFVRALPSGKSLDEKSSTNRG